MKSITRSIALPSAGFGLLCGFGTLLVSVYWLDVLTAAWALYVLARHRVRPPVWALAVAAVIAVGLFWTDNPLNTGTFALRLIGLAIIGRWLIRSGSSSELIVAGASAALLGQSILLWTTIDVPRPPGLSLNASQVSSTGLMLWIASPLAGIGIFGAATSITHMGIGLGRTVLLSGAVFSALALSRRRIVAGTALMGVCLLAANAQGLTDRLIPWGKAQSQSAAVRLELAHPPEEIYLRPTAVPTAIPAATPINAQPATPVPLASVTITAHPGLSVSWTERGFEMDPRPPEPPAPAPYDWRPVLIKARGFGWGSYYATVGDLRTHNLWLLTWYENGILSLVPFGVIAWAIWRRKLPYAVWGALLVLSVLTEEMTGRPEGFYMLALMMVSVVSSSRAQCSEPGSRARAARATPAVASSTR